MHIKVSVSVHAYARANVSRVYVEMGCLGEQEQRD